MIRILLGSEGTAGISAVLNLGCCPKRFEVLLAIGTGKPKVFLAYHYNRSAIFPPIIAVRICIPMYPRVRNISSISLEGIKFVTTFSRCTTVSEYS